MNSLITILYNWMDMLSMFMSKTRKPFWVGQGVPSTHPLGLQWRVLESKIFCCWLVCIHKFATSLLPNSCCVCLFLVLIFIHISFVGNNIKVCHALCCHVLVLELNMDVFTKVLEPLVAIPIPEAIRLVVHIDDEDSPVFKQSRKILDCE